MRRWVKTFYKNINSSVLYNGHCSNSFSVSRGVRQGDPLSPYLFIICAELLADAIKQNGQINGITVNNEEFLLGQYADDTFFPFRWNSNLTLPMPRHLGALWRVLRSEGECRKNKGCMAG